LLVVLFAIFSLVVKNQSSSLYRLTLVTLPLWAVSCYWNYNLAIHPLLPQFTTYGWRLRFQLYLRIINKFPNNKYSSQFCPTPTKFETGRMFSQTWLGKTWRTSYLQTFHISKRIQMKNTFSSTKLRFLSNDKRCSGMKIIKITFSYLLNQTKINYSYEIDTNETSLLWSRISYLQVLRK